MKPRFTLAHLMAGVALAALLLTAYRLEILPGLALLFGPPTLFGFGLWIGRVRPKLAGRLLVGSSLLTLGGVTWMSVSGLCMAALVLSLLILVCDVLLVVGCTIGWADAGQDAFDSSTRRTARWLLVVALMALPASVVFFQWPLHLAFALSRPALNRVADELAASRSVALPQRLGLLWIVGVRSRGGNVALLLDTNPGNPSGFVRFRDRNAGPPILGTDLVLSIPGEWEYLSED